MTGWCGVEQSFTYVTVNLGTLHWVTAIPVKVFYKTITMDNMHSRASFKLKLYVSILWMVLIEIFLVLGSGPCRKMPNVAWNAVNATNNLYWSLVCGQPIHWHSCIWHKIGLPCPMVFLFRSLSHLSLFHLSIYLTSVLTSLFAEQLQFIYSKGDYLSYQNFRE